MLRDVLVWVTTGLVLGACHSSPAPSGTGAPVLPAGVGPLPSDAVVWAVGDTVHVGEQTIQTGWPVRAMVVASGRLFFLQGRSDVVRVSDGASSRPTGFRTDELAASADGRFLGFLDQSEGWPWSSVVVDLESGEVVVRDAAGMGDADDDLPDLYEDAEPRVLGFDGDDLYVKTASGNVVMSWNPLTGERTEHGDQFFFARRAPGGGRVLPALIRKGVLVVPRDPYRSTQWGPASPDGAVALQSVAGRTRVYAVDGGRELPTDFPGRRFILGGWTDPGTAYGVAFDGSPFGPHRVRLVSCRLTLEQRRCRVLSTIQPPRHELVLFPTGSSATDY
ncbi:exported hypothetical protein [metagenome]|uniref:Lipoprotein n=1 Tax=metagenome TaxID=256318 RepID=A0A2P2CFK9_9ZZZZ